MNTCDTCKWWGAGSWGSTDEIQSCGKMENRDDTDGERIAFAIDKEGNQGFFSGPKFGCIHHEAK